MVRLAASLALALACSSIASPAAGPSGGGECHVDGFETPVRCVAIEVPLDYAAPAGRTITIMSAIAPASTARPARDPLFVFAGGPGQAGTEMASWLNTAFRPIRRSRDIVLVDFRGTGRSGALKCVLPSAAATTSYDVFRLSGERCAAQHGDDVQFYTHREVVEDIERVRIALGYDAINLWGGSFGTRIAQHYVRKYGAHVRSAVLDGATPVGESIFATAPRSSEAAFDRLFAQCANDADCARAFPQLTADLAELLDRAERAPLVAEVADPATGQATQVTFDRDGIVNYLRGPLYTGLTRAVVPHAIDAAARGDFAPLVALGAATGEWSTDTMAFGFTLGILCSEDVARSARDDPAHLTHGLLRDSYYRGFAEACAGWPTAPLPQAMLEPLTSTVPALVISGEADPVTPPSLGETTLAQFATRVHVIVPDGYHTNSSNPCVAEIIGAFVAEPSQGGRDHGCLRRRAAPRFFVVGQGSQL